VFILALLMAYVAGALALFAWRAPKLGGTGIFAPISREGGLVLNNLLLCSIAAVVLVGTLWPMFADILFGAKISVGAPFFNAATAPLAIPLVAAMAVGPLLAWKRADLAGALQRLWWVGLLAVASAFLTLLIAGYHVWPALGFAAAAWLIAGAAADILDRIAAFRRPSQAWNRARGLPRTHVPAAACKLDRVADGENRPRRHPLIVGVDAELTVVVVAPAPDRAAADGASARG
jgi:cytochrome c-type biogenesis protein CcmF